MSFFGGIGAALVSARAQEQAAREAARIQQNYQQIAYDSQFFPNCLDLVRQADGSFAAPHRIEHQ